MCCDTEEKTTSTQTSTIPAWLEAGSQKLVDKATQLADKDFQAPQLAIADFSGDQQNAFQMMRDLAAKPTAETERVVDEGGRLGKISDYMNPYLDPALRSMDEATAAQKGQLKAAAQSAGAFGDARHGIVENGINMNQLTARREAANVAFDKVMALRQNDLNRFTQVDKDNFTRTVGAIEGLLGVGGQQTAQQQAKNQAAFDQFMAQYGHDFEVLKALGLALGQAPHSKTTTGEQTTEGTDNSILGALGGAAQGFAGSAGGSALIAAML
jgi:hypothetical protein